MKNLWTDIRNKPLIHKILIYIIRNVSFTLGQELFSLRLMRNESDYITDKVVDWVTAKDALKKAEMIIQDFSNILPQISTKIKTSIFFSELINILNELKKEGTR